MKFKNFIFILIIVFLILFVIIFWMAWKGYQLQKGEVLISTDKTEYEEGGILKVKIKNNFGEQICFSSCYPYFLESKNEKWESYKYVECQKLNGNGHCLKAGELKAFELTLPQISDGSHRLAIPVCIGCKNEGTFKEDARFYSNEFTIREKEVEGITIATDKTEYEEEEIVKATIRNNLDKSIWWLPDDCTKEPLDLFGYAEGEWKQIRMAAERLCKPLPRIMELEAKESFVISYEFWETFFVPGKYKIRFSYNEIKPEDAELKGKIEIYSNEFTIREKKVDETANWKTYRNEEYKYELKYPKDWRVKDRSQDDCFPQNPCLSSISIRSEIPWVGIQVFNNFEKLSIKDWVNKYKNWGKVELFVEEIEINGEKGLRVAYIPVARGYKLDHIYFSQGMFIHEISRLKWLSPTEEDEKEEETINRIIFTFRFLE